MKALKYALHIFVFALMYIVVMVVSAAMTHSRIKVCIAIALILIAEYIYLLCRDEKRYFSVPLSVLLVGICGVFYFNSPENADMGLGLWVMAHYLVLPYLIASAIVSTIIFFIKRNT